MRDNYFRVIDPPPLELGHPGWITLGDIPIIISRYESYLGMSVSVIDKNCNVTRMRLVSVRSVKLHRHDYERPHDINLKYLDGDTGYLHDDNLKWLSIRHLYAAGYQIELIPRNPL
ncbi:hypothetical protein YerA41_031 [Yersinia phage YerA41]|nr:hypothetical protein YerA41_031 [Yersinia phage YerA41]